MSHYIRTNHSLYNKENDEHIHCKSINQAKKKSVELQKSGHTVSKSKKRTHKLHFGTASR